MGRGWIGPRIQKNLPVNGEAQEINPRNRSDTERIVRRVNAVQRKRKTQRKTNGERAGRAARIRAPKALEITNIKRYAETRCLESMGCRANTERHIGTEVEDGREAGDAAKNEFAVRIGPQAIFEGHRAAERELL